MKKLFNDLVRLFTGGVLSREAILSAKDIVTTEFPVPEWGGVVFLRPITVEQRMEFLAGIARMQELTKSDSLESAKAYFETQCLLLVYSIVDSQGAQCFAASDVVALTKKSPAVINRLYDEIVRLNSFTASAVEDEAKN